MEIITREEAKRQGLKFYYTGEPCKHGHDDWRYTSNRECLSCREMNKPKNKKNNDAAKRRWREENPDKDRESKQRYSQNNRGREAYYSRLKRLLGVDNNAPRKAKRRMKEKDALPMWSDLSGIRDFYDKCPPGYQVDHIIPVVSDFVCGLHCLDNLQYLSTEANRRKSNKLLPEHTSIKGAPKKGPHYNGVK